MHANPNPIYKSSQITFIPLEMIIGKLFYLSLNFTSSYSILKVWDFESSSVISGLSFMYQRSLTKNYVLLNYLILLVQKRHHAVFKHIHQKHKYLLWYYQHIIYNNYINNALLNVQQRWEYAKRWNRSISKFIDCRVKSKGDAIFEQGNDFLWFPARNW